MKLVYSCNELNYFTLVGIDYHIIDVHWGQRKVEMLGYSTLGIQKTKA